MPDIVLATLNAKYIHASFGLRYLMANLGELRDRACMAEFVINQQPLEIVEAILAHEPRIVGFGVYIWNLEQTTEVVALLKRIRPELIVILGGLIYVGLLIPELAVTVRRFHDQDLSGWLVLLGLIPAGGFVIFIFMLLQGTNGTNRHGPDPRAPTEDTARIFT